MSLQELKARLSMSYKILTSKTVVMVTDELAFMSIELPKNLGGVAVMSAMIASLEHFKDNIGSTVEQLNHDLSKEFSAELKRKKKPAKKIDVVKG